MEKVCREVLEVYYAAEEMARDPHADSSRPSRRCDGGHERD
jgi:hypothetical protein